MKEIILKVEGMQCGMCESHVNDAVCKAAASGSYVGDDGLRNYEPCAEMFLAAGLFAILILIPCIILRKKGIDKKEA